MSAPDDAHERRFDGIVCFGGLDWWYHNRGHYDLQMMRELSRHVPVLYVNSIAMRVPKVSEGRMFFRRVARKWKSLRRGLVKVRPGFGVFSPFAVPGKLGARLSGTVLPRQVRGAARRMGIHRPLLWVACPPAVQYAGDLAPVGMVYQRTDRFEAFRGVDAAFIGACNERLAAESDLTLFCSSLLMDEEGGRCRRAAFIDHGVDFDVFEAAGLAPAEDAPADVAALPRPRVGFVGGIDAHTLDPELLLSVARALPEVAFPMVGACSLPDGWCELPNVHLLGQRPYEEVARYMAACDVLVMPWVKSDWVRACNPVKLKEYLATGRPVVTSDFYELRNYGGMVCVARDADEFVAGIRAALEDPGGADARRESVRGATWTARADALLTELARIGLRPSDDARAAL